MCGIVLTLSASPYFQTVPPLLSPSSSSSQLSSLSTSSSSYRKKNLSGVYLHGGVGSGKTFVMDMFYATAPTTAKKRMHFTAFMALIHGRMAEQQQLRKSKIDSGLLQRFLPKIHDDIGGTAGGTATERSFSFFGAKIVLSSGAGEKNAVDLDTEDPLPVIAKELVKSHFLLCLDEFEVTDVADAFILSRLVPALFDEGAVIVTTSNRAPTHLYHDGLNRHVFLPAIKMIEDGCTVVSLEDSETDYRVLKAAKLGPPRFIVNDGPHFERLWTEATAGSGEPPSARECGNANGSRTVKVPNAVLDPSKNVRACRYDFRELFENNNYPLGGQDFSLIASSFDTVFVSDMRSFNRGGHSIDGLRRLVLFIDACYDERVQMYVEADGENNIVLLVEFEEGGEEESW